MFDGLVMYYHSELSRELVARGDAAPAVAAVKEAFELSCADLGRWMSGWGWWGHDLRPRIQALLVRLDGGSALASEAEYDAAMAREFPVPSWFH